MGRGRSRRRRTGLGTALEAVTRGHRTLLLEAEDFAKGTSSRSTKLVHGGVRYLQQGNVKLVLEALRERGRMLRNAPHLAHKRAFVIPAYAYWELPFYGVGLTLYDVLAGKERLGRSRVLSKTAGRSALPTVSKKDSRGAFSITTASLTTPVSPSRCCARFWTKAERRSTMLACSAFSRAMAWSSGVVAEDRETGERFDCPAKDGNQATGFSRTSCARWTRPKPARF